MTATRTRPATAPPTTGSCTLCRSRTRCESRAGTAEDWACRAALAAGLVDGATAKPAENMPAFIPAPRYGTARSLALIAEHRCPCAGCDGALTTSDYPSWRRCETCRCMWKAGEV